MIYTALCILLSTAFAQSPQTIQAYDLSFKLPSGWLCTQKAAGWKCIDKSQKPSDSILTVTRKQAKPMETITSFERLLSTPKNSKSKGGLPMLSKVIEVRKHTLQNQLWVEALHYQSEIENYYTHYAITLHQSTALLISLSNHKQALKTRQPLWNQIISSLKLNKTAESTTTQTSAGLNSGPQAFATPSAPTSNKKTYNFSLLAAIAALLAGLFYFAKKLYK